MGTMRSILFINLLICAVMDLLSLLPTLSGSKKTNPDVEDPLNCYNPVGVQGELESPAHWV